MRKTFNAKAAQAAGIAILAQHFDPHSDAYLLLGRINDSGYFVAWRSRHGKKLVDGTEFNGAGDARKHFERMIEEGERSEHPSIEKDWQQEAVYAWEEKFLFPQARTIDEAEVAALTRQISRHYKIPVSELVWGEDYEEEEGVELYRGDIDIISFLHEMAHHVHDHLQKGDVPALHGPGFVMTAIELYHRYAGIDIRHLTESAAAKNILGDPTTTGHILSLSKTGKANDNDGSDKKPGQPPAPKIAPG